METAASVPKTTSRWVWEGLPCEEGFPRPYTKKMFVAPNGKKFGVLVYLEDGESENDADVLRRVEAMRAQFLEENGWQPTRQS